jgi:CheY-like chemotaxis protein
VSKGSLPPKSRWHPLSLQQLEPNRFAKIVNQILDGKLSVIRSRVPKKSKRVLVTDDNEQHAQLLTEILEADFGLRVDWAKSADACIQEVQSTNYDLLILDYRLPRKDGLWIVDELVRLGIRIPVMLMTSFYHPQLSESIRRRVGVEIYDKGNGSFEDLARVAGRLLSRTAPGPSPVMP